MAKSEVKSKRKEEISTKDLKSPDESEGDDVVTSSDDVTEEEDADSSVDNDESSVENDESSSSAYESELEEATSGGGDENEEHRRRFSIDKYDSSDEEDLRNTIGNIPVAWYDQYDHIGYNLDAKKMTKPQKKSEMDEFLSKMEDPNYWRTVKDKQTGRDVILTDKELETIKNVQSGKYPKIGYNPYEPFLDLYSHETMIHPIVNEPDHKRSFVPSKLEAKKVSKLVHAIKNGWIKPRKPKKTQEEEEDAEQCYDLWASDSQGNASKSQLARMKMHIPAPKMKLPGHAESYNPPPEYLFTDEEKAKWKEQDESERRLDFIPKKFDSLRHVPMYRNFIKERFARCMDLYLAPRKRKMRLNVDPEDLLPKLPEPKDLRPFPTTLALTYKGHVTAVRCLSIEPYGQYFASGADNGIVRVWEVHSGRCCREITLGDIVDARVHSIAWCPSAKITLIAVATGSNLYLINAGVGDKLIVSETDVLLKTLISSNSSVFDTNQECATWTHYKENDKLHKAGCRIVISHTKEIKQVTWHASGDYFATVCPDAGHKSVLVHQLSKIKTQVMFSKRKGIIQKVLFHPSRPYFFVANERNIRVYNLLKQQLTKKLLSNCKSISSLAIHPKGDNLLVGSYDCRIDWFDLDLSTKPYKTMGKHHKGAVTSVCYHKHYPLFASASCDGTVLVSHGMVFSDLLQNPLIVPVKVLRVPPSSSQQKSAEFFDCVFHPVQPWLLTCGSDCQIRLFV